MILSKFEAIFSTTILARRHTFGTGMFHHWAALALCLLAIMLSACATAPDHPITTDPPRPNIIYILADDLGYGDIGALGQKITRTPVLDQLAREGMVFTQHYAGSTVCAPSRASLMTGLDTGHVSVRGNKELGGFEDENERGQMALAADEPRRQPGAPRRLRLALA